MISNYCYSQYLKLTSLLLPGFLSETIVPLDFSAKATRDAARAGIQIHRQHLKATFYSMHIDNWWL